MSVRGVEAWTTAGEARLLVPLILLILLPIFQHYVAHIKFLAVDLVDGEAIQNHLIFVQIAFFDLYVIYVGRLNLDVSLIIAGILPDFSVLFGIRLSRWELFVLSPRVDLLAVMQT